MAVLRILAFVFIILGFGMAISARALVQRFKLDQNTKCDFENEMDEEELKQYKLNKAIVNFKMLGMLVALPGIILLVIVFR